MRSTYRRAPPPAARARRCRSAACLAARAEPGLPADTVHQYHRRLHPCRCASAARPPGFQGRSRASMPGPRAGSRCASRRSTPPTCSGSRMPPISSSTPSATGADRRRCAARAPASPAYQALSLAVSSFIGAPSRLPFAPADALRRRNSSASRTGFRPSGPACPPAETAARARRDSAPSLSCRATARDSSSESILVFGEEARAALRPCSVRRKYSGPGPERRMRSSRDCI